MKENLLVSVFLSSGSYNGCMDVYMQFENAERILLKSVPSSPELEVSLSPTGRSEVADYFEILGMSDAEVLPPAYKQLCTHLKFTTLELLHAVPEQKLKDHLKKVVNSLSDIFNTSRNAEYFGNYIRIKKFLASFQRARIDVVALKKMIEMSKHEVVKSTLSSFLADDTGRVESVVYSTTATATGRLTVASGPQILTAPAEVRKCFRSRFEAGKILQLDIVSAEPKLALYAAEQHPPKDVYNYIANSILEGKVSRAQAKLITLCALYGQSARMLKRKLPVGVNPKEVIRKTKKYFKSEQLEDALRAESTNGLFRSVLGRPLQVPDDKSHFYISYYLQSSIAEGAILMFGRFIETVSMECEPLFIIHDALIVDCSDEAAKKLLSGDGIKVVLGEWEFDVDVKVLEDI